MGAVEKFLDGFNSGNGPALVAACAAQTGIIDDFPPHAWMSCGNWWKAFVAFSKEDGDTDPIVKIGTPARVDITGDVAYVVVPATFSYKHKGSTVTQNGSTWTLVLKNGSTGWHITAWAWGAGK